MAQVVLLRHGESEWNEANRFTGWTDVDLTEKGRREAISAGESLKEAGFEFEVAYTSVLKRAIRTLWLALESMERMWLEQHTDWRWNERHYGALQGLNKAETAERYGKEQVRLWRRSLKVRPPALTREDPRWPGHDPRYAQVPPEKLPLCESLADTIERVLPAWQEEVAPRLKAGQQVLIVAHGNSLRALVSHLEQLTEAEILALNIPTGVPLVYELDAEFAIQRRYYLGPEGGEAP